jgi:hypothetical protein
MRGADSAKCQLIRFNIIPPMSSSAKQQSVGCHPGSRTIPCGIHGDLLLGRQALGDHRIGGQVGPGDGLDTVEKRRRTDCALAELPARTHTQSFLVTVPGLF